MKKILLAIMALAMVACEQDTYDKGTGEYSLLKGDFAVAHTNSNKAIEYVVTDSGDKLNLSSLIQTKWTTTPDSLYRVIFYYNVADNSSTVEPYSISQVPTLRLGVLEKEEDMRTDPVTFESIWLGGGYVNLGLYLKTGTTNEEDAQKQSVGMIVEKVDTLADGKTKAKLHFYHDQGDYPEYYSSRLYLSIPIDSIPTDSVDITINTYSGEVRKVMKL